MKAELAEALERVHKLEMALKRLTERQDVDEAALHKLRGVFYGHKSQEKNRGGIADIAHGDKDALRALVGLRAGVKFTHDNTGG